MSVVRPSFRSTSRATSGSASSRSPPGVLLVTMSRPEKLNAMDQQWFAELTRLMRSWARTVTPTAPSC